MGKIKSIIIDIRHSECQQKKKKTEKKKRKKEEANFNTLTPQYMAVAQKDANCSMLTPQNLT